MAAILQRQDTGDTLVLDGLTRASYDQRYLVAQHPGQDVATLTDHVQRLAAPLVLEWTCSEQPAVAGITTGPERYDEVRGWLDGAVGVLLDYVDDERMTLRSLLLAGYPITYSLPRGMQVRLDLVTATIARTQTIALRARADVSASRAPLDDRGDVATKAPTQSAAAAALDVAASAFSGFLGG